MAVLTLVSLPIGNLGDLTLRAKACLENERQFLAEDTRVFKSLLKQYDLPIREYKITPFHDHSQNLVIQLIQRLDSGEDLFIVSDAGSPIISDPAFPLVRACIESSHDVKTIPGVSAVTTALELSGLPPHPFMFGGFLAREDNKKRVQFKSLEGKKTYIFFDGTSRILKTLEVLAEVLPAAQVCVARELTKIHESIYRFNAEDWETQQITQKGEFVLLIYLETSRFNHKSDSHLSELANSYLSKGNPKSLAKLLAQILDDDVNNIYKNLPKKS